jgi:hypothetical protein
MRLLLRTTAEKIGRDQGYPKTQGFKMVKFFIAMTLCLLFLGSPATTLGQTKTQEPLPDSVEKQKSLFKEPLDASLDADQREPKDKGSSDKTPKIEPNINQFKSNLTNQKSNPYGHSNTLKKDTKTPMTLLGKHEQNRGILDSMRNENNLSGTLLGGYQPSPALADSAILSPLSTYLNENKPENSLDRCLKSGIITKQRIRQPRDEKDKDILSSERKKKPEEDDEYGLGKKKKKRHERK